jgi:hypothetical protein
MGMYNNLLLLIYFSLLIAFQVKIDTRFILILLRFYIEKKISDIKIMFWILLLQPKNIVRRELAAIKY